MGLMMKAKGCLSVSCFVTHSVFPKESWKRFVAKGKNEGLFQTFYTCDTIPSITDILKKHKPFKVLPISNIYLPIIIDAEDEMKYKSPMKMQKENCDKPHKFVP